MYVVNKNFSARTYLLGEYFKSKPVSLTNTKIGTAEADGRHFGQREGIAEALAALLTEGRIREYPLHDSQYEMVNSWDVSNALKEFVPEFPAPNGDARAELLMKADAALQELMLGSLNWRANYAETRRSQIEKGKISREFATDEDKAFWIKEAVEAQERSEALQALAGK